MLDNGLDRRPIVQRAKWYALLVDYYKQVEHLSIDDAHAKADAIAKYMRENGNV